MVPSSFFEKGYGRVEKYCVSVFLLSSFSNISLKLNLVSSGLPVADSEKPNPSGFQ